jgi:RNA polymerase sigma-70 factor (ECF subfamily)
VPAEGDGALDEHVQRRQLDRAFDELRPDDRLILALRYVSNLSTSDVAAALTIPEGTVKSRTHAAVQRLRAAYDAEERR